MPTTYAIPNGRTVFDAVVYTGTNATQSQSLQFQPDYLWFKARSGSYAHANFDSVRGRAVGVSANQNYGESTFGTSSAGNDLASFDSKGFTVGAVQNWNSPNNASANPVVWAWNAGSGSNTTNTTGTITSTVSANTTAGFSIVQYACNHTSGATVGHGLGAVPQFMLVKLTSGAANWKVYHASLGNTQHLELNTTSGAITDTNTWNNTTPTSTVFTIGNSNELNPVGGTAVAYCWAEVAGFSKFGSYTGNGSSSGPFIYTGFQPRWIMIKQSSAGAESWYMYDTARFTYNNITSILIANLSNSESTNSYPLSVLSNGFQIPTSWSGINGSGTNYVYMAFGSNPFKYSNAF